MDEINSTVIGKQSISYQDYFKIWFDNQSNWLSIAKLLFDSISFESKVSSLSFLGIVTATESWIRVHKKDKEYDPIALENYNKLKENIDDPTLKSWFSNLKRNVTLQSLPKKLKDFVEDDVLGLVSNKKEFVRKCVGQRNFIAHNLLEKEVPANFVEVNAMSYILALMLQSSIMTKLGLDSSNVIAILNKSELRWRLENLSNLNSISWCS